MTEHLEDTQPVSVPAIPPAPPTLAGPPPATPAPARPVKVQMGRPVDYWLLWLVVLGSVALNVFLINMLLQIRQQTEVARVELVQGLMGAAAGVEQVQLGSVDYTVVIDEQVPIALDVPISETLTVPISHTIKVNSSAIVNVPVLGPQAVPFSINVPVNFDVIVPISRTIKISDTIPIHFDVPVSIPLDETPLGALKGNIRDYLLQLANELQQPGRPAQPTPGEAPSATP